MLTILKNNISSNFFNSINIRKSQCVVAVIVQYLTIVQCKWLKLDSKSQTIKIKRLENDYKRMSNLIILY